LFVDSKYFRGVIENEIHGLIPTFEFAMDLSTSIKSNDKLLVFMMGKFDKGVFRNAYAEAKRCHYLLRDWEG
jgi:hypothetical protein